MTATYVHTGLPPGPTISRTLQTIRWLRSPTEVLDRCRRQYGDMFTVRLASRVVGGPGAKPGTGTWVFLADPDHVRRLFAIDPNVVRTGATNDFLRLLVGPRSILVLDEPEHMAERKLLMPALHGERLRRYADLMADAARTELERWPLGTPFALWPRMQSITLEVIVRAVFGVTEHDRAARLRDALRTMLNRMTSVPWLGATALLATVIGPRRVEHLARTNGSIRPVDDLVYEEIRRRREEPDLAARDDILSMLMHAGMTDAELRDELITLLIAGHESTATALSWAFELLLRHPDALATVRAEARTDRTDYATAVARETLRLRPVLPFVLRKLAQPVQLGDHLLPARTWVAPCGYLIHRRPDVYPEPERFRPARFLDQPPGQLHLAAVRRRGSPLPRRELRPAGDGSGAANGPGPSRPSPRGRPTRAHPPALHHAGSVPRRASSGNRSQVDNDHLAEQSSWQELTRRA